MAKMEILIRRFSRLAQMEIRRVLAAKKRRRRKKESSPPAPGTGTRGHGGFPMFGRIFNGITGSTGCFSKHWKNSDQKFQDSEEKVPRVVKSNNDLGRLPPFSCPLFKVLMPSQ